jgi:hypothetical protein
MLGGALTGMFLLPLPAIATLTLDWTSGPTSGMPSLIGVHVAPTNPDTVLFSFNPSGTTVPESFSITGTATATMSPAQGNVNARYVGWDALHITGGTVTFQATYNGQVLWNPVRQFDATDQPRDQFAGIGQGANNFPQPATFTITFTNATWTVNATCLSPTQLPFFVE